MSGENGSSSFFESFARRLRDLRRSGSDAGSLRETLETLIDENEGEERKEPFGADERELLQNAVDFGGLKIEDVMVPRADIKSIEENATLAELLAELASAKHTRLVVRRGGDLDEVHGFVHIKDILPYWGNEDAFDMKAIIRPAPIVPPSMRAFDLLAEMRAKRVHLALVVDEYGGTDGLVTIEDLVEELVGDIEDEHDDAPPPPIVDLGFGVFEADARVELDELEDLLGRPLLEDEEAEEVDTLGGLVFTLADRVPKRGETIDHPRAALSITVLDAEPRRVKRLKLTPLAKAPVADDDE